MMPPQHGQTNPPRIGTEARAQRLVPGRLYKYVAPCRLDILQHGRIRITQPEAFNDPFEFLPVLPQLLEPNEILGGVLKALAGTLGQKIQSAIGTQLGILSLSEQALYPLMWAHYASSHEGFVIEMDTSHPFFDQRGTSEASCKHLRPVHYSRVRPSLQKESSLIDMYFTKSECWAYESEWRLVLPLRDCATRVPQRVPASDVCLFDLPLDSITAIIAGSRASDALKGSIKELVRAIPKLNAARLKTARVDEAEFVLKVDDIPPG